MLPSVEPASPRSRHHNAALLASIHSKNSSTANRLSSPELHRIVSLVLPSIRADISGNSDNIVRARKHLQNLLDEENALLEVEQKYERLISPCCALPAEVLSEIFLHARWQAEAGLINISSPRNVLCRLRLVCKAWHAVCISCAALWTQFYINVGADFGDSCYVAGLELFLSFSRGLPLQIDIKCWDHVPVMLPHYPKRKDRQVLDALFSHSHRWRSATLDFQGAKLEQAFHSVAQRLPILQSLSIHAFSNDHMDTLLFGSAPPLRGFAVCPRLRKVNFTSGMRAMDLPWNQITDLSFAGALREREGGVPSFLKLVALCPRLEIATFRMSHYPRTTFFGTSSQPTFTTHSGIRHLTASLEVLMDRLILPHLESINMEDETTQWGGGLDSLYRLIVRSNVFSLTRMRLDDQAFDVRCNYGALFTILSITTNLSSFYLHTRMSLRDMDDQYLSLTPWANEIARILASLDVSDAASDIFLPNLQTMIIYVNDHLEEDFFPYFGQSVDDLGSILKSRWAGEGFRGLRRLETFKFYIETGVLTDDVFVSIQPDIHIDDSMQEMLDEGMDLSLYVQSEADDRTILALDIGRSFEWEY